MMHRKVLICISTVLVGLNLHAQLLDKPVATVKLQKLTSIGQRAMKKKIEQLESQLGRILSADDKAELLELEIGKELILQAAEMERVRPTQEEVEQAILQVRQGLGVNISELEFRKLVSAQSGMSYEEYEKDIRERLSVDKYILLKKENDFKKLKSPTKQEIQAFYDENATRLTNPALVRFSHLFFDIRKASTGKRAEMRKMAQSMYDSIVSKKKTFEQLLDESLDNIDVIGADFGYLARGEPQQQASLGKKFIEVIFSLDLNDVSTVVESNIGYHIAKVTNKRSPKLLQLDDPIFPGERVTVRAYIENLLEQQKQAEIMAEAMQEVIDELSLKAEIRQFEENFSW